MLLSGTAVLIVAEEAEGRLTLYTTLMEPEKTYNVPKNVWHNIALAEDARVLIVENSNTHLGDFEFRDLSEKEKTELEQDLTGLEQEYTTSQPGENLPTTIGALKKEYYASQEKLWEAEGKLDEIKEKYPECWNGLAGCGRN